MVSFSASPEGTVSHRRHPPHESVERTYSTNEALLLVRRKHGQGGCDGARMTPFDPFTALKSSPTFIIFPRSFTLKNVCAVTK